MAMPPFPTVHLPDGFNEHMRSTPIMNIIRRDDKSSDRKCISDVSRRRRVSSPLERSITIAKLPLLISMESHSWTNNNVDVTSGEGRRRRDSDAMDDRFRFEVENSRFRSLIRGRGRSKRRVNIGQHCDWLQCPLSAISLCQSRTA